MFFITITNIAGGVSDLSWNFLLIIGGLFAACLGFSYQFKVIQSVPELPMILVSFFYFITFINFEDSSMHAELEFEKFYPLLLGIMVLPWKIHHYLFQTLTYVFAYCYFLIYFPDPENFKLFSNQVFRVTDFMIICICIFFVLHSIRRQLRLKSIALEDEILNRQKIIEQKSDELSKTKSFEIVARTSQMIAHDIRRPFTSIKVFLNLLTFNKTSDSKEAIIAKHGPRILCITEKAERMIEDILFASQPASIKRAFELCDPLEIITSVILDIESNQLKPVSINADIEYSPLIFVDKVKMSRVIENIIHNAIECLKPGGNISIATGLPHQAAKKLTISIENDGPQIPDSEKEKIFEPFFSKGKTKGTGLGLYLCKHIVEMHQGTIECISSEKKTSFLIHLPIYS